MGQEGYHTAHTGNDAVTYQADQNLRYSCRCHCRSQSHRHSVHQGRHTVLQHTAKRTKGQHKHGQHSTQEQRQCKDPVGHHPVDLLTEGQLAGLSAPHHSLRNHPFNVLIAAVGHQSLPVTQVTGIFVFRHQSIQFCLYGFRQVQRLLHHLVAFQQFDGRPVGGQLGSIGVVMQQLAHAVVNVVGKLVIQIIRLHCKSQMHLSVGGVEQLFQPLTRLGGDGHHRDAQLFGQPIHVDFVPSFLHLIHKIQCQHHRPLQLQQLYGEIQVSLQIGGIHNINDAVRTFPNDKITGHDLLHRVGGQGINAGQIHHCQLCPAQMSRSFFFLYCNARPVAHILIGSGQGVEQGRLTTVRVACQGDAHRAAVVGRGIIVFHVFPQLMLMILQLPSGTLRVGISPAVFLSASGISHGDLGCIRLTQGQLIATQGHLQRVTQRRYLGHLHGSSGGQTHIHQTTLHRTGLVSHREDDTAFSRLQIIQGFGCIISFHSLSLALL